MGALQGAQNNTPLIEALVNLPMLGLAFVLFHDFFCCAAFPRTLHLINFYVPVLAALAWIPLFSKYILVEWFEWMEDTAFGAQC